MQYYSLKDLVYQQNVSTIFSYDTTERYTSTLKQFDGTTQYFDQYGKLLDIADCFSNHVLFYYQNSQQSVYSTKISHIIDSYGQTINFAYSAGKITIIYPPGNNNVSVRYLTNQENCYLVGHKDAVDNSTRISYINVSWNSS